MKNDNMVLVFLKNNYFIYQTQNKTRERRDDFLIDHAIKSAEGDENVYSSFRQKNNGSCVA